MGTSVADPRLGGGRRADLGEVLLGGSPVNAPFWVINFLVAGAFSPLSFVSPGGGNPCMAKTLGGFRHRLVQGVMVKLPCQRSNKSLHHLPMVDAMRTLGLEELETYIPRKHNIVENYIATRTIMDL